MANFGGALADESDDTIKAVEAAREKALWRRYHITYALHMIIPIYGTWVFIYVILSIAGVV